MTHDEIQDYRVQRLADLLDEKFSGNKAALGKAMGYSSGAFVRQMIDRERPITEKTVARVDAIYGCSGWMSPPVAGAPQNHSKVVGANNEPPKHQASEAWPFATVTIERFEALGYEQKVIVEDALVQAIERMEQRAATKGKADAVRIDSTPQPKRGNGG